MTEEQDEVIRYWRVTDEYDKYTIIQANGFAVSERGDLAFHSDTSASWQKPHTVNKHFWRAVTECDKDGRPLWSKELPESATTLSSVTLGARSFESLKDYIESVTDSAIRKAREG